MIINKHVLVHAKDAGNGYHGNCQYCGLALVTDLGYFSWNDTKCFDREVIDTADILANVLSYANFNGLIYNHNMHLFIKPYSNEPGVTLDQLILQISKL